jgi:hypothetical protein
MSDLYNQDAGNGVTLGDNARRALPTSRFGTRNLVWYSFFVDYDLLHGEEPDNYTAYNASDSFYNFIVLKIQEAGELYHLGAPTNISENGFVFAIADNDAREPDGNNNTNFRIGYGPDDVHGDDLLKKSSVYQALYQRLGSDNVWNLTPCFDQGWGITQPLGG